jgi:unsaturated rhamnogalacturonyl hydrolase
MYSKLVKTLSISILSLGSLVAAHAQSNSHAAQVAEMAMKTLWKDSTGRMPHPRKWTYDQAVVLLGIEGLWYRTGDARYFDYMQKSMDRFVQEDGTIDTYEKESYNIDNVACGRILLALYKVTGKEKYFKAANTLREQLKNHPRTQEGSFWHKKIYPSQVWLDGLYMAQPFYAEWAQTFKEGDKSFDDIANQFIWIEKHTRNTETGLMHHAWDESKAMTWADKTTGIAPNVWARAMGWYGAALVDVLEYFPDNHPKKKELIAILNRYATAITKAQDPISGLWWDVMNKPYPGKKGNYFEASAAAQFVYTLTKGARLGYLKPSVLPVAQKGYKAILAKFLVKGSDGLTHYDGTVSVSGLGGKPYRDGSFEYYISEKIVRDDAKGVGAFIQAANEIEMLPDLALGKGKKVLLDSYYNNEHDKDILGNVRSSHYKWDERSNGGYQFWGKTFQYYGASLSTASTAPSTAILKNQDVYIIVDPDINKENPDAKFMNEHDASAIYDWIKAGGTLVLMLNDSGNCDLTKINILTKKLGFTFNSDSRNHVEGRQFEQGALYIKEANPVFKTVKKVYLKEISTINVEDKTKAKSVYTDKGDVLMVTAKIGKGKVFAVGDPWIYNEYVDGRKLPAEMENFKAMDDLTKWILSK